MAAAVVEGSTTAIGCAIRLDAVVKSKVLVHVVMEFGENKARLCKLFLALCRGDTNAVASVVAVVGIPMIARTPISMLLEGEDFFQTCEVLITWLASVTMIWDNSQFENNGSRYFSYYCGCQRGGNRFAPKPIISTLSEGA